MKDNKQHILAGLLIAAVVALPVYLETHNLFAGLWACLAGVVAGGVKEWSDMAHDGAWNWKDFGATCLGVVIAELFILAMHFAKG